MNMTNNRAALFSFVCLILVEYVFMSFGKLFLHFVCKYVKMLYLCRYNIEKKNMTLSVNLSKFWWWLSMIG